MAGLDFLDPHDYPVERGVYALRDVQTLQRQAPSCGEAVGRFSAALLDNPLPWTGMRRVYALLGLARRYGNARVNEACTTALAADRIRGYVEKRRNEGAANATINRELALLRRAFSLGLDHEPNKRFACSEI